MMGIVIRHNWAARVSPLEVKTAMGILRSWGAAVVVVEGAHSYRIDHSRDRLTPQLSRQLSPNWATCKRHSLWTWTKVQQPPKRETPA